MLSSRLFQLMVLTVVATAGVGVLGCSDSGETPESERAPQSQAADASSDANDAGVRQVTIAEGRWPTAYASSLGAMVAAYDTIVVGEVTGATDATFSEEDAHADAQDEAIGGEPAPTLPSWHPKAKITPVTPDLSSLPPTATHYSVRVIRSLGSAPNPGSVIRVGQIGGLKDGVAFHADGDSLIQVGATYLFFLRQETDPSNPDTLYAGAPFGRFEVGPADVLAIADESWFYLPVVVALEGVTVDEAEAQIAAAAAAGPPPGYE